MSDASRSRSHEESRLLELAARRLPGGVLGSARFADDVAFVIDRGRGAHVWDVSGREYVDYLLGSGPMVLGHAHPAVVDAVRAQLEKGTTFFLAHTEDDVARTLEIFEAALATLPHRGERVAT